LYEYIEIDNNNFFAKINYINQTLLPSVPLEKINIIGSQIKQLNESPEGVVPPVVTEAPPV